MFSSPPPFSFTPSSLYQGFLAFRRRCGETLQDFCCPPGACGPSPNPPPVTLPQHPRPEILQDPPRSPKILHPKTPFLQLPSSVPLTALWEFWLPRPILGPLVAHSSLQRLKWELRLFWLWAGYVIRIFLTLLFSREENLEPIYNVDSTSKTLFLFSQSLLGFSAD